MIVYTTSTTVPVHTFPGMSADDCAILEKMFSEFKLEVKIATPWVPKLPSNNNHEL